MLDKEHRICPCCGKKLVLTGKVMGDSQHERIGGYRSDTYAQHYHHVFERDNLWCCTVDMFCSECGAAIKLQHNPRSLLVGGLALIAFATMISVVFGICANEFTALVIIIAVSTAIICNIGLMIAYACRLKRIKRWRSNFVPAGGEAEMADITLKADISAVPRQILYPANIFLLSMRERSAALYLTDFSTDGNMAILELRICSDINAKSSIIDYIRKNSGALTLDFEGNMIQNAELIKISDEK